MNRIRDLRKEAGWQQSDLSAMLSSSRQAVSKWETGQIDLNTDTIRRLCEIFHVSADYLLGFSSRRSPEISPEDGELLAAYHAAPEQIRRIVDAALEDFREKEKTAVG